jgi:hypothetical protein
MWMKIPSKTMAIIELYFLLALVIHPGGKEDGRG